MKSHNYKISINNLWGIVSSSFISRLALFSMSLIVTAGIITILSPALSRLISMTALGLMLIAIILDISETQSIRKLIKARYLLNNIAKFKAAQNDIMMHYPNLELLVKDNHQQSHHKKIKDIVDNSKVIPLYQLISKEIIQVASLGQIFSFFYVLKSLLYISKLEPEKPNLKIIKENFKEQIKKEKIRQGVNYRLYRMGVLEKDLRINILALKKLVKQGNLEDNDKLVVRFDKIKSILRSKVGNKFQGPRINHLIKRFERDIYLSEQIQLHEEKLLIKKEIALNKENDEIKKYNKIQEIAAENQLNYQLNNVISNIKLPEKTNEKTKNNSQISKGRG